MSARQISSGITIRLSSSEDRVAIQRLAELDSRRPPPGVSILAIVNGQLRAALPLGGGDAVADPFLPTTGLVELLRVSEVALISEHRDRRETDTGIHNAPQSKRS